MMTTICAFCLSNDRILTLIDEKYWKIIDFCINTSEDRDKEYLQCLQRKQALQICWECSTKLKNFHQFISTSQQCVRVLNTYLEASIQILPPTTSNLYRTNIEIMDTNKKYKEFKTEEETQTEVVADTIHTGPIYKETETEDTTDKLDMGPIYEESETEHATETLDVKMEIDSFELLPATTSNLYRTQIDIVATDPKFEETKTEYVSDTKTEDVADTLYTEPTEDITYSVDIEPIYEETETEDVTETSYIKMENDSLETELNDIPDNNNGEVINSDIREDPCKSENFEIIKEQVVWWRVILHRLPTDTLPANIMSSDAPLTICDGTNNSRIEAIEDVLRLEALHIVTDSNSKQRPTKNYKGKISEEDEVINNKTAVFKIAEQNKGVSKSYICDYCKQQFHTKMTLQQHISIHYGVSKVNLTCQTCNYKGVTVQALEKHSRLHDEERRFKCNSCTYRFRRYQTLMEHVQTHTGVKQYKCDLCDFAGSQSGHLKSHMRLHTGEKPYKCELCDYASNRSSHLKSHMRIHTGEKPYKCDLCDYASSFSSTLKSHMRIHTGEKQYKCELCSYAGSQRVSLKSHMRIHTEEKPYKCDSCDYASNRIDLLKSHLRIHTGEKPYKCDSCDYASNWSGRLKSHMRIHTGEKPYECDLCDYATSQSDSLKSHMRIHTGEKPYKCDMCEYRCIQSGTLNRHKKRVHATSSAV